MEAQSKLAVFDMDGTLINGRLIEILSNKFGLYEKVKEIQNEPFVLGHIKTQRIASLLKGIEEREINFAIESIPFMEGCKKVISTLRKNGYKMGIVTDSYSIAANVVVKELGLDFLASNELKVRDGLITGEIYMPLGWEKINCHCKISVCKRFHLEKFAKKYNININNTLAIGDTKSDLCMINRAGTGIAFMPKDDQISKCDKVIYKPDLSLMLDYIKW
jgi:phosphoserine phosphatase